MNLICYVFSESVGNNVTINFHLISESIADDYSSSLDLPLLNDSCNSNTRHQEVPPLNLFPHENIYETAAKLLYLSVKWAKTIPSFLHVSLFNLRISLVVSSIIIFCLQLSVRDQSILLEESWNELFVLTAAQWSFPIDEGN